MSFLRHRETHQSDAHLRKRARPVGHALAHRGDESPVGYSWRVALQHCPLPLHQPRLIVREPSVEGKSFFNPAGESLNFLSHSRGALQTVILDLHWFEPLDTSSRDCTSPARVHRLCR